MVLRMCSIRLRMTERKQPQYDYTPHLRPEILYSWVLLLGVYVCLPLSAGLLTEYSAVVLAQRAPSLLQNLKSGLQESLIG